MVSTGKAGVVQLEGRWESGTGPEVGCLGSAPPLTPPANQEFGPITKARQRLDELRSLDEGVQFHGAQAIVPTTQPLLLLCSA